VLCLAYLLILPFSAWGMAALIGIGAIILTLLGRSEMATLDAFSPKILGRKLTRTGPRTNVELFSAQAPGGSEHGVIQILDLASHQITTLPVSVGLYSQIWSPDGRTIAAQSSDNLILKVIDLRTQKWSELATGHAVAISNVVAGWALHLFPQL
jgi:WD40 repeat protein